MLIAHPRKHGQCTQRAPSDLETALADRAMYSRSEVPPFNPYFPYEEGVCITENTGDAPELDDGGKRRKAGQIHRSRTLLRTNLNCDTQHQISTPKSPVRFVTDLQCYALCVLNLRAQRPPCTTTGSGQRRTSEMCMIRRKALRTLIATNLNPDLRYAPGI